jgi:hypothetical protein
MGGPAWRGAAAWRATTAEQRVSERVRSRVVGDMEGASRKDVADASLHGF